jgi:hypothetical protein
MGRTRATLIFAVSLVLALGASLATAGPATAARASTPAIGPHQHFVGLVNGKAANAVIEMVCLPPLNPGETGHPLQGQTVAVEPPPATATTTGYTGSRGRSVVASFVSSSAAATSTLTFTHYGSQTIPDTFTLPCSGSSVVRFSPVPTSKTAQSATVSVTYGNITAATTRHLGPRADHGVRTIKVTQADNGDSYTLRSADRLVVQLSGPTAYTWTEPASSDPTVLHRLKGSSGATATADFVAKAQGKSDVTAIDNPNCLPRCGAPSLLFEVRVSVTG